MIWPFPKILLLVSAALLVGCVSDGPDPAWVQTTKDAGIKEDTLWAGGTGSSYGIPTEQEAFAFAKANKGKLANFVGFIYAVNINGNHATIEVEPRLSAESEKDCLFIRQRKSFLNCLRQNNGLFTSSVICHFNNWREVNKITGGRIAINAETRSESRNAWDGVGIEGIVSHAENKVRQFQTYNSASTPDFGLTGGYDAVGFGYRAIHLKNCRMAIYRGRAVSKP